MEQPGFFGEWLRQRRSALDLTRVELAQCAGCSVSALRKIESGERRPSKQLARLLADCLSIPPDKRPTFLKVARGQLRVERLTSVLPTMARGLVPGEGLPQPRPRLPTPPTPLIGREPELAALARLVHDPQCRLLTLVGPGGIGKTRLAIEVTSQHQGLFPDGACFASLASLNSPAFLVPTIAGALGFAIQGQIEPHIQLFNFLREKQSLLVLDSIEHLLEGAGLFAEVLERAPGVKLLMTSREKLNLRGEWVFEIQGLPVPPTDQAGRAEEYSSVTLFVQSARRARTGFELLAEERPSVVRICQMVDGMPLGIELAAVWVSLLTCREIAQEIGRNLDFLATTMRDVPERHRSMRAVFDHSWRLLSEDERRVLRQLSVFRGGFGREATEQVAGATLPLFFALADKSLLYRDETDHYNDRSVQRYELHELTRQYAQAKLLEANEATQVQDRHLDFFLRLAEEAENRLEGTEQAEWYERLEIERDNLRVALAWAQEKSNSESAFRLCGALGRFWEVRGYWSEGRHWVEQVLAHPSPVSADRRAKALTVAGRLAFEQRDLTAARGFYETGLALRQELADSSAVASLLNGLGNVAWAQGDPRRAGDLYNEVLALERQRQDEQGIARVLNNLGLVAMSLQQYERAAQFLDESASLNRDLGNKQALTNAFFNLGLVTVRLEDGAARAAEHFAASVELSRELGYRIITAYALNNLAMLALHKGNEAQAAALAQESLELCRMQEDRLGAFYALINLSHAALDRGDPQQAVGLLEEGSMLFEPVEASSRQSGREELVWFLEAVVRLAIEQGQTEQAVRLAGSDAALREAIGADLPPSAQAYYTAALSDARSRLGEAAYAAAWAAGRAMSPEQATHQALVIVRSET